MVKEMKDQYKKYTEEIKTKLIEAWKEWRFHLVKFIFPYRYLHDDLLDKKIVILSAPYPYNDTRYGRYVEMQYERYLFANELVPMVKPFLLLIRIVPGQEEAFLTRGPLPQVLTIGPWSILYAGIAGEIRYPVWPDEAVRSTRGGASWAARRCALREYCRKIMASSDSSFSRRSIPVALLCACPKRMERSKMLVSTRRPGCHGILVALTPPTIFVVYLSSSPSMGTINLRFGPAQADFPEIRKSAISEEVARRCLRGRASAGPTSGGGCH